MQGREQKSSLESLIGRTYKCSVVEHLEQEIIASVLVSTTENPTWGLRGSLDLSNVPEEVSKSRRFRLGRLPAGSTFKASVRRFNREKEILELGFTGNSAPVIAPREGGNVDGDTADCPCRYLVVVDFEATCDYGPKPRVGLNNAEIIEFPWVVLDTVSGEIVHEEQHFIRPDDIDNVTHYCTRLTGITVDMVKDGLSLKDSLEKFDEFIKEKLSLFPGYEGEDSFCIVTDGKWDLQVQLFTECKRKDLERRSYLNRFYDLKQLFRMCYPWLDFPRKGPFLKAMLSALQLDFVGRHHSGIDDCKSIVSILQHILGTGIDFGEAEKVSGDYQASKDTDYDDFSVVHGDLWQCEVKECAVWNSVGNAKCRFCDSAQLRSVSTCRQCGGEFEFFARKVSGTPSRAPAYCQPCRQSTWEVYPENYPAGLVISDGSEPPPKAPEQQPAEDHSNQYHQPPMGHGHVNMNQAWHHQQQQQQMAQAAAMQNMHGGYVYHHDPALHYNQGVVHMQQQYSQNIPVHQQQYQQPPPAVDSTRQEENARPASPQLSAFAAEFVPQGRQ